VSEKGIFLPTTSTTELIQLGENLNRAFLTRKYMKYFKPEHMEILGNEKTRIAQPGRGANFTQ
jgi:hypothetical protein